MAHLNGVTDEDDTYDSDENQDETQLTAKQRKELERIRKRNKKRRNLKREREKNLLKMKKNNRLKKFHMKMDLQMVKHQQKRMVLLQKMLKWKILISQ
jgi:FtsZ-interacting cell division protein YlmF